MAGDSKEVARAHLADAGVEELPDDWDVVTLGDLFTEDRGIAVGVMYPGDHDPDGVPLIKAGDLNGSIINPQPDFRISKDKHHEYRRTALEGGELLMTLVGNVGQCAVVPRRMAGWNTARAVAVMRLADSSETQFVQQCLLSRPLQHLMDVWCNTTVQATLNLKEIRQLPLPWPPKKSRDAIAAFGKALDDKIELNRRMNATLEAMARALFQSWFVDFDPVRAKLDGRKPVGLDEATAALFPSSFQESSLGPIPHGWDVCPLSEKIQLLSGGTPKTSEPTYWDGDIPWYSVRDAPSETDVWVIHTDKHVTKLGITNSAAQIFPEKTTIISARGTVGKLALTAVPMAMNQSCYGVRGIIGYGDYFTYFSLREATAQLQQRTHGTVFDTITTETFRTLDCIFPTPKITAAFDKLVEPLLGQIRANLHQARTLAALRDTLLPNLLSGELSVAGAEATSAKFKE